MNLAYFLQGQSFYTTHILTKINERTNKSQINYKYSKYEIFHFVDFLEMFKSEYLKEFASLFCYV